MGVFRTTTINAATTTATTAATITTRKAVAEYLIPDCILDPVWRMINILLIYKREIKPSQQIGIIRLYLVGKAGRPETKGFIIVFKDKTITQPVCRSIAHLTKPVIEKLIDKFLLHLRFEQAFLVE
jgi:hypothetical protein